MSVKQIFNTSAELDYPTVLPTLDLDFANTKALDPRITFTRASGGSYVGADGLIKYAGVNEARFDHDPVTGESLGLLVEEARTNSFRNSIDFLYSQNPDHGWTKSGTSIVANTAIAPDGTLTASKIVATATTEQHRIFRPKQIVSPAWSSIFLKAAEYTVCDVYDLNVDTGFRIDLTTGVLSESPSFVNKFRSGRFGVDVIGNGWYRVRVGFVSSDGTVGNPLSVFPNGAQSYTGNGTSGVLAWGAQLEAGAFATSFIPTPSATTVTRAADVASITGTNFSSWFNRNNGTLLCNAQNFGTDPNPPLILTATPYYQGPGGYKLGLAGFWSTVTQLNTDAWANGIQLGGSAMNVSETPAASATIRHSFAYSPTECRACVKQTLGTLGGSQCFQAAQGLDQLLLRQYFFTVSSRISRLTYYPKRLTNAQLQTLTR